MKRYLILNVNFECLCDHEVRVIVKVVYLYVLVRILAKLASHSNSLNLVRNQSSPNHGLWPRDALVNVQSSEYSVGSPSEHACRSWPDAFNRALLSAAATRHRISGLFRMPFASSSPGFMKGSSVSLIFTSTSLSRVPRSSSSSVWFAEIMSGRHEISLSSMRMRDNT